VKDDDDAPTNQGGGYDVGYGKPPKASQFKKGQRANPNGRPKGSRNLKKILDERMWEPIEIQENGRVKKMSVIEAMFLRARADALKGDRHAREFMMKYATTLSEPTDQQSVSVLPTDDEQTMALLRDFFESQPKASSASTVSLTDDEDDEV